ncbi:hypothetical protein Pyn_36562 [Prunus yedoensis var. nudiflora]|uniref:Major facilitator superfamily (MFS) profile domain-containing protein n=1 Tax=Prunus yedoensis var. nudiflora TaxID=2094558 RepID=A0A314YL95_PRUYE|nr:hypothetical protein Pyn_36562 [Prunus yedoensis var. nudiflora]
MLFLTCLVMSLSTFLTAFSSNIWIYSILRFITGFGRATIGTSALVLSTELVGRRWRGQGFYPYQLLHTLKELIHGEHCLFGLPSPHSCIA